LPNSAPLNGFESGGGYFPLVLRLVRTRDSREAFQRAKERKNDESIDSIQNDNFTHHKFNEPLVAVARPAGVRGEPKAAF
jgi:hypothetical protein